MRAYHWLFFIAAACGGNDAGPRIIPGGGVGDGAIDGTLHVGVIDTRSYSPISGATVEVGSKMATTNDKGLASFSDLSGAQTITVKAANYRSAIWVDANGANVTVPLTQLHEMPPQATLTGTITGYDAITVPTGHVKIAAVFESQTDDLGDPANNLTTPNSGNICLTQTMCNWTLASRTGTVTLIAAIMDQDTKGTPTDTSDDTRTVIGYAIKTGVVVAASVNQSGLALTSVEAGNLETVTVDYGTPPAALTTTGAIVGIEVSKDEVVQLPLAVQIPATTTTMVVPKPTVFAADATRRLTAIAQTSSGDKGAQSIVVRHALTSTTLAAGTWLDTPTGVMATRTSVAYDPVAGAKAHSADFVDSNGDTQLEITVFSTKAKTVDIPSLVALPSSGALTVKVNGIAADFDVTDFSLDTDRDKLTAIAAQPVTVN
ncbi:MAG: hypothetical protein JO257_08605 [Deltaproteobacteria bacterium]|nr:hypothetical protein [Deltaproteobacteria bacterium]